MADEKKEPSAPHGETDRDTDRNRKTPKTGEPSAPYGHEGPTETESPAEQQPS